MRSLDKEQVLIVSEYYGVNPCYSQGWLRLLNDGHLDDELGTRIATCDNYRDCLHDLLELK